MIEVDAGLAVETLKPKVAFGCGQGLTALFGRSGCDKSITLNLITGLLKPDERLIRLDGNVLVDTAQKIFLPPHQRHIGVVFQDSNLFPPLSVRRNLLYGRPIIYVSHSIEEVIRLASRVVMLDAGQVKMIGTPDEVFTDSASLEDRFDSVSVVTAEVLRHDPVHEMTELQHPAGQIWIGGAVELSGQVRVAIAETAVVLSTEACGPSASAQSFPAPSRQSRTRGLLRASWSRSRDAIASR
ncbi:ATP-binding cassette domain-containing protein [Beijerinckia mobilis]|uniref:ATP-binding cassette domain-containing protein n=1 Tax=Beijerinckia mobilis TaxID=231434 RepID=UPI000551B613|nr:ATP-binding cassette domain-containing protein [Beijerinckia mobilis]